MRQTTRTLLATAASAAALLAPAQGHALGLVGSIGANGDAVASYADAGTAGACRAVVVGTFTRTGPVAMHAVAAASASCAQGGGISGDTPAIAGGRVYWLETVGALHQSTRSARIAGAPHATTLQRLTEPSHGLHPGLMFDPIADGTRVLYGVQRFDGHDHETPALVREVGRPTPVLESTVEGAAVAISGSRALLVSSTDATIVDADDGHVLATIAGAGRSAGSGDQEESAFIDATDVAIVRDGRLHVYDADGAETLTRPLDAEVFGIDGGQLLYTRDAKSLHLLDIASGRDRVVYRLTGRAAATGAIAGAAITAAGVVYAVDHLPGHALQGRIGAILTADLPA